MEYTIGTKIPSMPGWEIVRELGEGSYGKVFEVHKNNYDVTAKAALKMIRIPKSVSDIREAMSEGMDEQSVTTYFEGIVKRFVKEIAVMSELKSHPNIVACEDYVVEPHAGNIGWDILIRMELLNPLVNYQLKTPLNEEIVKRLAIDMCEALVFCQKKGLIHRDIKPANIFVDETGRFKLGDFGVARSAEKTMGGYSKQGTENYMAPEVYLGRPYGATVDIYSLGLVLYRLMNGNRLPSYPVAPKQIEFSDRENALVARMRGDMMLPPCNASEEFAAIILKACAYDSKDRYRTAAEMLEELKNPEKKPKIQVNVDDEDKTKGHFFESEEEDDGSIGSIGINFVEIRNTKEPEVGVDEETEEPVVEANEIDNYQDEESIGSIGISWKKKEKVETAAETEAEVEAETCKNGGNQEDEIENEPEEKPEVSKTKANKKSGISMKIVLPLILGIGVLVGIGAVVMKPKDVVPPLPEDTIRIGLYDDSFDRTWSSTFGIESAYKERPSVQINGKEYAIELIPSKEYRSCSNREKENYAKYAVEMFCDYGCSVVLDVTNSPRLLPQEEELPEHSWPIIKVRDDGYYSERYDQSQLGQGVFSMLPDGKEEMRKRVKFMLQQVNKPIDEQVIMCFYSSNDQSSYDTSQLLTQKMELFVECVEEQGGSVTVIDISDSLDFAKIIPEEYWNIGVDFVYSTFTDGEDSYELEALVQLEQYLNQTFFVFTENSLLKGAYCYAADSSDAPYDARFMDYDKFDKLKERIKKANTESYVEDEGFRAGESLYHVTLDALEIGGDLNTALANGTFETEFYGEFRFAESGYAGYDRLALQRNYELYWFHREGELVNETAEDVLRLKVAVEMDNAPYSDGVYDEEDGYIIAVVNALDEMIPEFEFQYSWYSYDPNRQNIRTLGSRNYDFVFFEGEQVPEDSLNNYVIEDPVSSTLLLIDKESNGLAIYGKLLEAMEELNTSGVLAELSKKYLESDNPSGLE